LLALAARAGRQDRGERKPRDGRHALDCGAPARSVKPRNGRGMQLFGWPRDCLVDRRVLRAWSMLASRGGYRIVHQQVGWG
jgi:hypothetical protein